MQKQQYDKSQNLYERAAKIPGRSLTRSKAPGRLFDVGAGPLYASYGDGAYIVDVDANSYIDMICALGAISLGYGVGVDDLVSTVFSLPSSDEVYAAELALTVVAPWATHVRFVKTGSEATHAAYRIARAREPWRTKVAIGDWAYHGWHDWCQSTMEKTAGGDTFIFPHHYEFDFAHPDRMAAIFIEPHRWEPIDAQWLRHARDYCTKHGILLVFDEMIYGGRWAIGGATEHFRVEPDIACFGKAFGNGAPVAFVVGKDALAEHGEIVSGTYSGDVGALAAFNYVATEYSTGRVIDKLWNAGERLAAGLTTVAASAPVKVVREGAPVHQRLRFDDPANGRKFAAAMARRGVLWHPDVVNVSAAHTPKIIATVVDAALDAMRDRSTWT